MNLCRSGVGGGGGRREEKAGGGGRRGEEGGGGGRERKMEGGREGGNDWGRGKVWRGRLGGTHIDVLVLVPQEEVVQNTSFMQVTKTDLWGRRTEEEVFTNQVTWDSSLIPHQKSLVI